MLAVEAPEPLARLARVISSAREVVAVSVAVVAVEVVPVVREVAVLEVVVEVNPNRRRRKKNSMRRWMLTS
jgi:hypothetical protein